MDAYKIATELYSSSLRALEQRATAFLTTQSLLVAAFAVLFTNFQKDPKLDIFLPILGICLVGLTFSFVFYSKHQITSKDAAFWRAYGRFLEDRLEIENGAITKKPWQTFYNYCNDPETKRNEANKLPGPLLWLISPAIFLIAWICILIWVIKLYVSPSLNYEGCIWLWITIMIIIGIAIILLTWYRYHKADDKIYDDITKLP